MAGHTDISGCRIFDAGELGALHVLAHRMLDSGQYARGHRVLRDGLRGRTGCGSGWVHVQWHMLVFELAVGRFEQARERFEAHVLPAIERGEALTDGPAALWRLTLAAPFGSEPLPWRSVQRVAETKLPTARDPFEQLHHLLALAGARDLQGLGRFIGGEYGDTPHRAQLLPLARALHAYAAGHWARAVAAFDEGIAQLPRLGGSHAQNGLFLSLRRHALLRAQAPGTPGPSRGARLRPGSRRAGLPQQRRPLRLPHAEVW